MEMVNNITNKKNIGCNTCTRELVELAYKQSFWFRFLREPLKFIMRWWVIIFRIDLKPYQINSIYCKNCNRMYKNALKDNSKLFVKLNNIVNPYFDKKIENILGKQAINNAKQKAKILSNHNDSETTNTNIIKLSKWTKI